MIFMKEDALPCANEKFTGLMLLKPEVLGENYRTSEWQLVKIVGGFGCDPEASGRKIFVEFAGDGERTIFTREDFLGFATEDTVKAWKAKYGSSPVLSE